MPSPRDPAVKSADMPSRISLGLPPCGSASCASPTVSCAAAAWVEGDGLSNRQRAIDTAPNVRQGLRLELLSVIVSTGIVAFQFSLARKNDMREWRARPRQPRDCDNRDFRELRKSSKSCRSYARCSEAIVTAL